MQEYYAQELFDTKELTGYLEHNMIEAQKSVYEYVVYDSDNEAKFAQKFEANENVKSSTNIHAGWWWGKGEGFIVCAAETTGQIKDVTIENCHFIEENPSLISGAEDITLKNLTLEYKAGSTHEYYYHKMDLQPNVPDLIEPAPFEFGDSIYVDSAEVTVDGEKV